MERKPNTTCSMCKKTIYRRPIQIKSGNVYCSSLCCGKHQRISRVCTVCGKTYFGIKRTCSRECANKSRTGISYTRTRPSDKANKSKILKEKIAHEHGGVCGRCGEKNYAILQVHHKHERHRGGADILDNLELLCPNCHMSHHLGHSLFQKGKNAKVRSGK